MIDVTVKTLDAKVKNFSVNDDITVKQFKERISHSVNIPAERQRLIFCGRVLVDDKSLNQNGSVHGKTLHLVERLPVPAERSSEQRNQNNAQSTTPITTSNQGLPSISQLMGGTGFSIQGGGIGSSANIVQQVLEQALSGMGASGGASVVHGTVRQNPTSTTSEQRMDIRIHITPSSSTSTLPDQSASSGNTPSVVQSTLPSHTASSTTTNVRHVHQNPQPHPQMQQETSEPRRKLNLTNALLDRLNHVLFHLNQLPKIAQLNEANACHSLVGGLDETKNSAETTGEEKPEISKTDGKPENETTSTEQSSSSENGASSSNTESLSSNQTGHPSLSELHKTHKKLERLNERFKPYYNQYLQFLENDPAFTSKDCPEYKQSSKTITYVLQAQRLLGEIYKILSTVVIPVSVTPPRVMLIQAPPGRTIAAPREGIQLRENSNAASAGSFLMHPQPQERPPQPIRPVHTPQDPRPIRSVNVVRHHVFPIRMEVGSVLPNSNRGNANTQRNAGLYDQSRPQAPQPHHIGFHVPRPGPPGATVNTVRPPTNIAPVNMFRPPNNYTNIAPMVRPPNNIAPVNMFRPPTNIAPMVVPPTNIAPMVRPPTNIAPMVVPPTNIAPVNMVIPPSSPTNIDSDNIPPSTNNPNIGSPGTDHAEARQQSDGTINVTATINPRININIMPYGTDNRHRSYAGYNVNLRRRENMDVDPNEATGNRSQQSQRVRLPNIPGVDASTMQRVLQTVNQAIASEISNGNISSEAFGLNSDPRVSSTRFHLEGDFDPDDNTVAEQISDMVTSAISQALTEHMCAQHGSNRRTNPTRRRGNAEDSDGIPPAYCATADRTPEPMSVTDFVNSDHRLPYNMELAQQIYGGSFGNAVPNSSAATSEIIERARASNENNSSHVQGMLSTLMLNNTNQFVGSLPRRRRVTVQPVPRCVNGVARHFGASSNFGVDDSALVLILHYAGEFFTVNDVTNMVSGQYNNIRHVCQPLRNCLRRVFFDGKQPTQEQLQSLVEEECHGMVNSLRLQLIFEKFRPGYDVPASNVAMFKFFLRELLEIIFNAEERAFGSLVQHHIADSVSLCVHLNNYLFEGGETAVTNFITNELSSAIMPLLGENAQSQIGAGFVPLAKRNPKSYKDFKKYLVRNVKRDSAAASTSASSTSTKISTSSVAVKGMMPTEPQKKTERSDSNNQSKENDDWEKVVPEEWVGIINEDLKKQNDMETQADLSDAYSNGMPATKRRKVVS